MCASRSRIVLATAAVVAAVAVPAAAGRRSEAAAIAFSVESDAPDRYSVRASFEANAPVEVAWDVLSDYERIVKFVTSVKTSRVREREANRVVVEQEGVGRVLLFSKRVHVVLEILEDPGRSLTFRDLCGRDFRSYAGSWRLEATPRGARVSYSLEAAPISGGPSFAVRKVLRDSARKHLQQVRAEIERRALRDRAAAWPSAPLPSAGVRSARHRGRLAQRPPF
jgi:uncharacterized membrane protein